MNEYTEAELEQNAIDNVKAEGSIRDGESAEDYTDRLHRVMFNSVKTGNKFTPQGFRSGQFY